MQTFTVFALYEENLQRFADSVTAASAAEAEQLVRERAYRQTGSELLVAAVVAGTVEALDAAYADHGSDGRLGREESPTVTDARP